MMDDKKKKYLREAIRVFHFTHGKPNQNDFLLFLGAVSLQIAFILFYGRFPGYLGGLPLICYGFLGFMRKRVFSFGFGRIFFDSKDYIFPSMTMILFGLVFSYFMS